MNCHYCNQVCRCNVSSWICNDCRAEFFDGHINLYTTINGTEYTFQMRFGHYEHPVRILGSPKGVGILLLPKIPDNITPSNVNEKVRLYLLFS